MEAELTQKCDGAGLKSRGQGRPSFLFPFEAVGGGVWDSFGAAGDFCGEEKGSS